MIKKLVAAVVGALILGFCIVYIYGYSQQQCLHHTKGTMNSIQTTSSGLKYIVLNPPLATAGQPKVGQKIAAHYTGWVYDETAPENKGAQFDSSVDRGKPLVFVVGIGQVIQGWDEALLDMKVGEKRRLIIPASLGYGDRAVGTIPANAILVFDVELVEII